MKSNNPQPTTQKPESNRLFVSAQKPIKESLEPEKTKRKPPAAKGEAKIDPLFFEYAKTRNVKIRNELIKKNTPLVSYIFMKFYGNNKSLATMKDDIMQEGLIGLMSAIEGFRPELGFRFSTYSAWWIRQSINNYILNVEPMIHVPSHVRIAKTKMNKQLTEENASLGEQIASHGKASADPLEPALSAKMLQSISRASQTKNILSFDEPSRSGEPSLAETIPYDRETNTELLFDGSSVCSLVHKALSKLSEKEKLVLLLRFDIKTQQTP